MSDFIYTRNTQTPVQALTDELHRVYDWLDRPVFSYSGEWGKFAWAENTYPGYHSYETEEWIAYFLGGPVFNLPITLKDKKGNTATKAFLEYWLQHPDLDWANGLDGPFCFVALRKADGHLTVVTDKANFIPVYYSESPCVVSSHVEMGARISGKKAQPDEVSVLEFVLSSVVTFPHTVYKDLWQMTPGSQWEVGENTQKHTYWEFPKVEKMLPLKEAAQKIHDGVAAYVAKVCEQKEKAGILLSAGSDSRVVLSLLSKRMNSIDAFTFVDQPNRESRLAGQIAKRYGAKHTVGTRKITHYFDHAENAIKLVGPQDHFMHSHTVGFAKPFDFAGYDAVFGGLISDTLLKSCWAPQRNIFYTGIKKLVSTENGYSLKRRKTSALTEELKANLAEAFRRRENYSLGLQNKFGPLATEWESIWPMCMYPDWPNFHFNRRLFPSYEPFTCNQVLQVSPLLSQFEKANKLLFWHAFKSNLKETDQVPHGEGYYPHKHPWMNLLPVFMKKVGLRLNGRMGRLSDDADQGPWPVWSEVLNDEKNKNLLDENGINISLNVPSIRVQGAQYQIRNIL